MEQLTLEYLLELEDFTLTEWGWYCVYNLSIVILWKLVAPQFRILWRNFWREGHEWLRRLKDYYSRIGGPSVIPKNLNPELSIFVYLHFAINTYWVFVHPHVAILFVGLATITFLLWQGSAIISFLKKFLSGKKPPPPSPEEMVEISPFDSGESEMSYRQPDP